MAINFSNIDSGRELRGSRSLKGWIKSTIEGEGRVLGDIAIAFCSDTYIKQQNTIFLAHDYFTDILTFSYNEGEIVSGDLLISTDTVASNALVFKTTYTNELHRVIIHGVLHLLDYDDTNDELQEEMTKKENEALAKLEIKN